jgi:hypothetical protein
LKREKPRNKRDAKRIKTRCRASLARPERREVQFSRNQRGAFRSKKPPIAPPTADVRKALANDEEAHLEGYKKTVPRIGQIAKRTKKNDAGTSLPPFRK